MCGRELSFEEYCAGAEHYHPSIHAMWQRELPSHISDVRNMIFYGPNGGGKLTQALCVIKRYSKLQHARRLTTVISDKMQYTFRVSDLHFEIDMSLLGCNAKMVWHEIFSQIAEVVCMKKQKVGIIVCLHFHMIHGELLDAFYSYMQHYRSMNSPIQLIFFLLTEQLSFLPTSLLESCALVPVKARNDHWNESLPHETMMVNQFVTQLQGMGNEECTTDIYWFREHVYDILTFHVDPYVFSRNVLFQLLQTVPGKKVDPLRCKQYLVDEMPLIWKRFNNNYRSIFHLEILFVNMVITFVDKGSVLV
jgi:hypothetical protein